MRKAVFACFCFSAATAWGQGSGTEVPPPPPRDRLVVSGRFDRLVSLGNGGAGGVSWLRASRSGLHLQAGAYSNRIGATSWHFGKIGVFALRGRSSFSGSLDLGGGKEIDEGFLYLIARAGAGFFVVPRTVSFRADAEYLDVHQTKGLIAKGAVTWQPSPRFGVTADYRRGLSDTLDVEQFVGRADVFVDRVHLLGGVSTGTFLTQELLILNLDPGPRTEWFGGVGAPLGDSVLTVVWSTSSGEASTRHSVSFSLQLNLRERR